MAALFAQITHAREIGLTSFSQLMAPALLTKEGPITLSDLSRRCGLTPQSGTFLADTLQRLNFANRRNDTGDRRLIWMEITPEGKAACDAIHNQTTACHAPQPPPPSAATDPA